MHTLTHVPSKKGHLQGPHSLSLQEQVGSGRNSTVYFSGACPLAHSGKILIPSWSKHWTASHWIRMQSTSAHKITLRFQKPGPVRIWPLMSGRPWLEALSESTWVIWIPDTSFFFCPPWFLVLFCASLLQKWPSLCPALPDSHTHHRHTYANNTRRQVPEAQGGGGRGVGNERSPSQQVF